MFKKFMVLSEFLGGVDCKMFDSYIEALTHKMAAECGAGARCSQIYEWDKKTGEYKLLCE